MTDITSHNYSLNVSCPSVFFSVMQSPSMTLQLPLQLHCVRHPGPYIPLGHSRINTFLSVDNACSFDQNAYSDRDAQMYTCIIYPALACIVFRHYQKLFVCPCISYWKSNSVHANYIWWVYMSLDMKDTYPHICTRKSSLHIELFQYCYMYLDFWKNLWSLVDLVKGMDRSRSPHLRHHAPQAHHIRHHRHILVDLSKNFFLCFE